VIVFIDLKSGTLINFEQITFWCQFRGYSAVAMRVYGQKATALRNNFQRRLMAAHFHLSA
jgi:hypothetical protein